MTKHAELDANFRAPLDLTAFRYQLGQAGLWTLIDVLDALAYELERRRRYDPAARCRDAGAELRARARAGA